MIDFRDEQTIKIMSSLVEMKLEEGLKEHKLVDVSYMRYIGKSYALARIAEKYNIPIVTSRPKEYYTKDLKLNKNLVYEYKDIKKINRQRILIDEDISIKVHQLECNLGFEIATGLFNSK